MFLPKGSFYSSTESRQSFLVKWSKPPGGFATTTPAPNIARSPQMAHGSFASIGRACATTGTSRTKKPDGVGRIISLGDSFTIGYEADVDQTFSAVLERELRKPGHDVEVLNAGVSGFSNAEEVMSHPKFVHS